jgi:hypothetical protein
MATTHDEDLWPEDIATVEVSPPVAILREQAKHLGERTKQVLTGEVTVSPWGDSDYMILEFSIVAPNINYRYTLFRAVHRVADFYPVDFYKGTPSGKSDYKASDEQALRNVLKHIFAEPRTKKIVSTLLAQSRS